MPTLTHAPTSKPSLSISREYARPFSISSRNVASSLVSEDGNTDFSVPSSPLSSLRITPDLEFIDPRILDPIWPKDDCLHSIDGICPAVCTENGVPRTGSEELRNDPVIIQPVRHTDFHEALTKVFHTIAESTSANTPAVCPSIHLSSPDIGSGDKPPNHQKDNVLSSLFIKVSLQTSFSKGPITRSKARATLSEVAHSNSRERLYQTIKGQSSRRNQATSHLFRKQSLR
ncbi:uncharacterized protein LDX57_012088 [Aspergillus melleus]|uniref:uncharacterized protein n=1 Tax=Aspergillus melleus TaxID=138277 RepID=UPI001E8CDA4F|nr:uncharacterized protein LDX57_012088 [Aspergillus melleus]KAH8434441.1 hypothetical protein LDX57_012088 [Aspergillus melleus]